MPPVLPSAVSDRDGWLVVVLPVGARRFRVADAHVAATLTAAGATRKVRIQQRALELRELAVEPKRRPEASAFTEMTRFIHQVRQTSLRTIS